MEDIHDIIDVLYKRIDKFAEHKDFGDSYAYKHGAAHAALSIVFDGMLNDTQMIELNKRVSNLYKETIG